MPSEFGDKQYVRGIQAMSTDAVVPVGQRRRTPRNKMPMAAPAEPRAHPGSAKVVKSLVECLLQGPFNALTGTVMKDLEGYALGSNQFNAAKVLPQDHTIFAATAAWVLEAHRATQAEERAKHPDTPFDVSPVGALADVGVFNLALRLCREFEDRKHWMQLTVMVRLLKQLFLFLDEMVRWEWGGGYIHGSSCGAIPMPAGSARLPHGAAPSSRARCDSATTPRATWRSSSGAMSSTRAR